MSGALMDSRLRRRFDTVRFWAGLWIARGFWAVSEALLALGNWFEDLATALHPRPLRDHWNARHDGGLS